MSVNDRLFARQSLKFPGAGVFRGKPAAVASSQTITTWSGFLVRQRLKQDRLHEREDRRVGADAKRQRPNRGDGEDGRPSQQAQGVPQVGKEIHAALDGRSGLVVGRWWAA